MGAVRSGVDSGLWTLDSGEEEPGSPCCAREDKVGWDRGILMGDFAKQWNQKTRFLQNQICGGPV